jgi:hypothetical protein
LKVFIGLTDISSLIGILKIGFEKNGYDVMTASTESSNPMLSNIVDFNIDRLFPAPFKFFPGIRPKKFQKYLQQYCNPAKNYVFKKALKECDIFIFMYNTFYDDFSDLEILKKYGKKVVFIFTGGHEIWYFAAKQEFEKFGMRPLEMNPEYYSKISDLQRALKSVRMAERYADLILSAPMQSQLLLRPYMKFHIPISDYYINNEIGKQRKVPRIIHAPSSPTFKGTKYVIEAINKLKSRNDLNFEFELVHNVKHEEAIKKMWDCDIIINQLLAPSPGKLGFEGLAMGKVVLTFIGKDFGYDEKLSNECPIVDVCPDTLEEKLVELILNTDSRQVIANQGPDYIRKFHNPKLITGEMLKNLNSEEVLFDFVPNFFRKEFIPESKKRVEIYNQWTDIVRNELWYDKYVEKGRRDDLEF